MGDSVWLEAVEARPSVTAIAVHLHIENTTLPRLSHASTRAQARAGNVASRSPTVRSSSEAVGCYGCGSTGVQGS